jgi:hypothetical protein
MHSVVTGFRLLTERKDIRDILMGGNTPDAKVLFDPKHLEYVRSVLIPPLEKVSREATRRVRAIPKGGFTRSVVVSCMREKVEWSWSYPITCMSLELISILWGKEHTHVEYLSDWNEEPPSEADAW